MYKCICIYTIVHVQLDKVAVNQLVIWQIDTVLNVNIYISMTRSKSQSPMGAYTNTGYFF